MSVDLSKVNHILLNSDGSVIDEKLDYYIQQGSNSNQIFFGSLAVQPGDTGNALCTLPNGTTSLVAGVYDSGVWKINGVDTTIYGFLFTLGTTQTNYAGGLMMPLVITRSNARLVSYPLYLVINETGVQNDTDTGLTVAEINTYLKIVTDKMNISDGILVIPNLASVSDWTTYNVDQLFLDRSTGKFEIRTATIPYHEEYEIFYVHKKTTTGLFAYTHNGTTEGELAIDKSATGNTLVERESDGRVKVTTPTQDGDATTKKYVDDNIDDYITLTSLSGTLSEENQAKVVKPNIRILYSGKFYEKYYDTLGYYRFVCADLDFASASTYKVIDKGITIYINKSTFVVSASSESLDVYNKDQTYSKTEIDTLLNDIITISGASGTITGDDVTKLNNPNIRIYNSQKDVYYERAFIQSGNVYFISSKLAKGTTGDYSYLEKEIVMVNPNVDPITFNVGTIQYNFYDKSQTDAKFYNKTETDSLVASAISSGIFYKGSKTVSELNALDKSTLSTGWMYNVSDTGTLTWTIEGVSKSLEIYEGENVIWVTGVGWDKVALDLSVYDDKFIAAGFFEVQSYNDSTGNITFVYASDLYNMSYDSDTGIMTIEAN